MALSLFKAPVVNNASGNVQLNFLLYSMYEVRQCGAIHFQPPQNVGDGQAFAIRVKQIGSTGYNVTWDAVFEPASMLCTGHMGEDYSWIGFFICDNGKFYCMSAQLSDTPD